jgi:hypothetical protein
MLYISIEIEKIRMESTNISQHRKKRPRHKNPSKSRKSVSQLPPPSSDQDDDDAEVDEDQERLRLAAEERYLTASLFGHPNNSGIHMIPTMTSSSSIGTAVTKNRTTNVPSFTEETTTPGRAMYTFEVDRTGDPSSSSSAITTRKTPSSSSSSRPVVVSQPPTTKTTTTVVAWVDDDDEQVRDIGFVHSTTADRVQKLRTSRSETTLHTGSIYQERLRQRYIQTAQATSQVHWAKMEEENSNNTVGGHDHDHHEEEDHDNASDLYSTSTDQLLLHATACPLRQNKINMKRCPDVNLSDPNQSVVQVVQFHPSIITTTTDTDRPLLLTAGLDKSLRFFQCGEEGSQKIHGVHCKLWKMWFCYSYPP